MSLPNGIYNPATITLIDAGNEMSNFTCYGKVLTEANFDDQRTLFTTLIAKVLPVTLGQVVKTDYGVLALSTYTQPTNGAARETKLLIQYRDNTNGQKLTCTLPTLDPTVPTYVVNVNAKDVILTTTPTAILEFVTAFEAFAVPPLNPSHTVTVIGLKVVGRNT